MTETSAMRLSAVQSRNGSLTPGGPASKRKTHVPAASAGIAAQLPVNHEDVLEDENAHRSNSAESRFSAPRRADRRRRINSRRHLHAAYPEPLTAGRKRGRKAGGDLCGLRHQRVESDSERIHARRHYPR